MKTPASPWSTIGWLVATLLAGAAPLRAQINDWTNPAAGKWEVATNWSLGTAPGTGDASDNISAGAGVTIDATTSGSFPGTMTVNNLALGWPVTLELNNAGTNVPLHVLTNLDITYSSAPEVLVTNSALQVDGVMTSGNSAGNAGTFELDSGSAAFGSVTLGNHGTGDLFLNGGTLTVSGTMTIGNSADGSGSVIMSGGNLIHTNNPIALGSQGAGVFTITGGSVSTPGFLLGNGPGSQGSLSINGGTISVSSNIQIANSIVTNPCAVTVSTNGTLAVTNAAHTAFIDIKGRGNTLTLNGGVLQTDNLILTNGGSFIYDSGTLNFAKPFQLENGSSVIVSGGTLTTIHNFTLASSTSSTGSLTVLNGGTLNISNATLGLGNNGTIPSGAGLGMVNVSNGTLNASSIILGSLAGGSGSSGGSGSFTLQAGGTVNVVSNFAVLSGSLTSTSTVAVISGTLNAPNGTIAVGLSGNGQMSIGGTVKAHRFQAGGTPGTASGSVHLLAGGTLASPNISANSIDVGGGELDASGGTVIIGEDHNAEIDFNDGTGLADTMYVGYTPGYTGTYVQNGGQVSVTNELIVGDCLCGALGVVALNGGTLWVTNDTQTAVLDVCNGTVTLNAGATLVVDNFILTNACGHFVKNGGLLIQNNPPVLDPNLDADGDGQSNGAELLAGTDPLDPTSVFRMLGATVSNQGIWVTWTSVGGHSYVVQASSTLQAAGFQDFSPLISVPGTNAGTMSYLCTRNSTNSPGFYRVRLGP